MARKIDTDKSSFTKAEAAYLRQRPWLLNDEVRAKLEDGDTSPDEEGEDEGYQSMSKKELRIELKNRDLDYSDANKDELIARLEADDEGSEEE